jgi:arylsulfatase
MAVYAAQVDRLDRGVGTIARELEQHGLLQNTLIIFLSDNGGCAEFLAEESSRREPFRYNIPTPDGRPMRIGNTPAIDPGGDDTFASYDLPWANASNTPFRLYKHWVHEGGISTPCILSWPGEISSSFIEHTPCHVTDITATCLEAAGVPPLQGRDDALCPAPEGESFLELLQGGRWTREAPVYIEHEGNCAVRHGEWKLVRKHPEQWELYNMTDDRTELHDLAEMDPDRVRRMAAMYDRWADRCGVIPREELAQR